MGFEIAFSLKSFFFNIFFCHYVLSVLQKRAAQKFKISPFAFHRGKTVIQVLNNVKYTMKVLTCPFFGLLGFKFFFTLYTSYYFTIYNHVKTTNEPHFTHVGRCIVEGNRTPFRVSVLYTNCIGIMKFNPMDQMCTRRVT